MSKFLHTVRTGLIPLSVIAACMTPQAALASGVLAGTLIENTASATYTSGSSTNTVNSNTVSVKVDELLDVSVEGLTTSPVTVGAGTAVLEYRVTNTGNGPEAFKLVVDPAVAGNNFDAIVQSIVIDSNGNGVYDAGTDTVLPSSGETALLAANAAIKVFVLVQLPANVNDQDTSQVRLTADALTGTGTPGTSFAGKGEGGTDAVVGASGASANALDSLVASLATVTLTKSASIVDPFGGAKPVPGAVVTYSIEAKVLGTGSVDALHVTDNFPTGTAYQSESIKLDGTPLTDATGDDAGMADSTHIDVNLGTVSGGTTKIVTFKVKIN